MQRHKYDCAEGSKCPGSVFMRVVGPSLHRHEHQNQAVADTGSEHFAVRSRSSYMATARRGNFGEMATPLNTTHCKSSCSCVSGTHARPAKEAWSLHGHVNAASSEIALGKEMASRGNSPNGQMHRWWRSHESYGVWAIVVCKGTGTTFALCSSVSAGP